MPSRTPLEATWGPPKTPLLLLLPEEVRRRNGRLPLLLTATTTGIIVSCDDAPAIIISIKGVLLILQRRARRLNSGADFSFFRARCLFVGWRVAATIDSPLEIFSSCFFSLSLSLKIVSLFLSLRPLGCSHGSENAKTKKKS